MSYSLSPETQRLVDERLQSGHYPSFDDLLCAALSALDHFDAADIDEETLDAIDRSEDQIERGEIHDLDDVRAFIQAKYFGGKAD